MLAAHDGAIDTSRHRGTGFAGPLVSPPRGGDAEGGSGVFQDHTANKAFRSAKALSSMALPEGSRKNIVACSPGWPLKRT